MLIRYTLWQTSESINRLKQWFSTFLVSWPILCFLKVCIAQWFVNHCCWTNALWPSTLKKRKRSVLSRSQHCLPSDCPDLQKKIFTSGRVIFALISKKKGLHLWESDFCFDLLEKGQRIAVFPLRRFFSANRRFVGARANNFWQYSKYNCRKFDKFVEI